MKTPALMILGTSSHVGKSLLTAAFCRIFSQAGYRVSPFKAQNMSLNSAATPEGLEIGRAQALQAEAAGIPASVHMNPVLLKPSSNTASQVIVRGKIFAQLTAEDYFRQHTEELVPVIQESYELLAAQSDLMLLEGAGSPAEINLKDRDIVNLRMAQMAGARCVLVGDIDRGGVFASLLGTLELLEPAEQNLIEGFIINRFRGDLNLLLPGITTIEQRMGKPCMGIVPFIEDLRLDEEDSVSIETMGSAPWQARTSANGLLRIAIMRFPFISNFTDFDPLFAEPSVNARFCRTAEEMNGADVVILPGSKQTVADLRWMRATGLAELIRLHAENRPVVGICGGMQMLGKQINDPWSVEGACAESGLGLLSLQTMMGREKTTREVIGEAIAHGIFGQTLSHSAVRGYEIHIGETQYLDQASPFARIFRAGDSAPVLDGCVSHNGRVLGTYLHGIFHDDAFRHVFLSAVRSACGLPPATTFLNWKQLRASEFDRLAGTVAKAVDVRRLLECVGLPWPLPHAKEGTCAAKH